jgi:uncharacterized tellurite resistance protein B-like protein
MNIAKLGSVIRVLQGGEAKKQKEQKELFNEVLLMTLARASRSDVNIHPVEVDTIRKLVAKMTGEQVTAADVRVAAMSEIYETTPLEKALHRLGNTLSPEYRANVVQALAKVIRSDTEVSAQEIEFFNMVSEALDASPAEIAGLIGTNPI